MGRFFTIWAIRKLPLATGSIKILQSQGVIFSLDSDEKEMIGMEREQNKVLLFVLTLQEEHSWLWEHRCRTEQWQQESSRARPAKQNYSPANKKAVSQDLSEQIGEKCGILWKSINKDFILEGTRSQIRDKEVNSKPDTRTWPWQKLHSATKFHFVKNRATF